MIRTISSVAFCSGLLLQAGLAQAIQLDLSQRHLEVRWSVHAAHPNGLLGLWAGTARGTVPLPAGGQLGVLPDIGSYWTLADGAGTFRATPMRVSPSLAGARLWLQVTSIDPVIGPTGAGGTRLSMVLGLGIPEPEVADVYLLFGQSNAEGYAGLGQLPGTLTPPGGLAGVLVWNENRATPAWEHLEAGRNNNTSGNPAWCGPEMSLADALFTQQGRPVHLLKFAVGETSLAPAPGPFDEWGSTAHELYGEMLNRLDRAVQAVRDDGGTPRLRAAFFMQGESDSMQLAQARRYEELLRRLVTDLRAEALSRSLTDTAELPFVVGQISSRLGMLGPFHVGMVRDAQASVANRVRGVGLVDTSDLSLKPDSVHFDTCGVVELGRRFANEFAQQIGQWTTTVAGSRRAPL